MLGNQARDVLEHRARLRIFAPQRMCEIMNDKFRIYCPGALNMLCIGVYHFEFSTTVFCGLAACASEMRNYPYTD